MLFQVLFLAVYDFFLSKETFFTTHRWYLLGTAIVSFVMPIIKIPSLQKAIPQEFVFSMPEMMLTPEKAIANTNWLESLNAIQIVFWCGVFLFSILFIIKLIKVFQLIYKNERITKNSFTLVLLVHQSKAFSFFNYIFLGKEIPKEKQEKIIEHELVHSQQKHSLDLLFFEFLRIVMWFNPMVYFYQKRITLLHEYISDAVVAKSTTKEKYINTLLSDVFQVENISFVNQFYKHSFIKKRIIMMTKTKSKQIKQLKYLLLVPVLASMLLYTSCSENQIEPVVQQKTIKKIFFDGKEIGGGETRGKESYFDLYMGKSYPKGKELTIQDLSNEEQLEIEGVKSRTADNETFNAFKLFLLPNGRKAIAIKINFEGDLIEEQIATSKNINTKKDNGEVIEIQEQVSFMIIDKAPVFPGCEGTEAEIKKCFSKSVSKHFGRNFNTKLPNQVGLSAGKKRVFIGFKIDKEGNVVDIKARAPHPDIKEEVIRIMETLPKMIPGEHDGKPVAVKYNIPFILIVE